MSLPIKIAVNTENVRKTNDFMVKESFYWLIFFNSDFLNFWNSLKQCFLSKNNPMIASHLFVA